MIREYSNTAIHAKNYRKILHLWQSPNTKISQCWIILINTTYRGNDAPHLKGHRTAEFLHKDVRWNWSLSLVTLSWHPEHAILSFGQACAVISSRAATCWHPSLGHLSRVRWTWIELGCPDTKCGPIRADWVRRARLVNRARYSWIELEYNWPHFELVEPRLVWKGTRIAIRVRWTWIELGCPETKCGPNFYILSTRLMNF